MRSILAAHTRHQGIHDRLREALESTTSMSVMIVVDFRGTRAGFFHRNARCWLQRALPFLAGPSRGGALDHHGTSPPLLLSGAFWVTPRVATCTGPLVEDWPHGWTTFPPGHG